RRRRARPDGLSSSPDAFWCQSGAHGGQARPARVSGRPGAAPAGMKELPLSQFLDRLASSDPTPGGGTASAVAGAMAAGLLAMVSRLSAGEGGDVGVAALLAHAEVHGALLNVRINLQAIKDPAMRTSGAERADALGLRADALRDGALAAVNRRLG